MNLNDAIDVIESAPGFTDETTPVGEAWAIVLASLNPALAPVPAATETRYEFCVYDDYKLTPKDAQSAAEELRKRKIKSLERQLASLERQLAKAMTQQIPVKRLSDCGLPLPTGEPAP